MTSDDAFIADDDDDAFDGLEDLEPYCATCGAKIGHFIDHGEAWHHFTGTGTVADPNRLYDPGHDPVVAWREP
jgi:hypothetical protein